MVFCLTRSLNSMALTPVAATPARKPPQTEIRIEAATWSSRLVFLMK